MGDPASKKTVCLHATTTCYLGCEEEYGSASMNGYTNPQNDQCLKECKQDCAMNADRCMGRGKKAGKKGGKI